MRFIHCFSLALALLCTSTLFAQTPINAPGAMQPSTGTGVYHFMTLYREFGSDPTSSVSGGDELILLSQIAYGVTSVFSLQLDVPVVFQNSVVTGSGSKSDDGFADLTLLAKYRIYQDDPAPTDTTRFSLIGGLQIPGNVNMQMDSSSDAWDPILGCVFSTVHGRHGFNADMLWEFYTGSDANQSDSLRYDASYLFRLSPAEYTADTRDAIYLVAELNGFYGTNGDHELFFSPGIMYEAPMFTLDATIMIPLVQEVDHRSETDFIFGFGIRISF